MDSSKPATPPPTRKRRRRLASVQNARTLLADTLRALEDGEMEPKRANAIFYGCSVFAGIFAAADVEARLGRIEAAIRERAAAERSLS